MINRTILFFVLLITGHISSLNAQNRLFVMQHSDPDTDDVENISEQGSTFFFGGQDVGSIGTYEFQDDTIDYEILYALIGTDNLYGEVNCHGNIQGDIEVWEKLTFNGSDLNDNEYGNRGPCYINYQAVLVKNLEQPNDNERCEKGLLFDGNSVDTGIGYWEYSIDNNQWHTVEYSKNNEATVYRDYPLKLSLDGFIANLDNYTGAFHVRFKFEEYTSDVINFVIIQCSPQLVLPFIPEKTSCPETNDGGFTMNLYPDLEEGEQPEEGEELLVVLYAESLDNPGVYDLLVSDENTNTLIDNGDNTYGYQWPNDIPVGNYKIKYQTRIKNAPIELWDSLEFSPAFTIVSPDPVTFEIERLNDVYCYEGSDGRIQITASGGTDGNYQYSVNGGDVQNFSNQYDHTITGLPPGDYEIEVWDANDCMGEPEPEEDNQITIGEPDEPVSIVLNQFQEPSAFGFTNGSITVEVSGGTLFPNNSYEYEWTDEEENPVNTTTAEYIDEVYRITLEEISAGTYTLTVKDANYNVATQTAGCTYTDDFEITEPPLLELSIEQTAFISCNSSNTFNNPSADGQLTAIASGGVPFDPLINGFYAYIYTWKKKDSQDVWQVLPNETSNLLNDVEVGEYAVNIEDANGIIVGTYFDNILEKANDETYLVEEPELLTAELEKTDVSCFNGNDGTATVFISGGTAPYDIFWSTGDSAETIDDLIAGTYMVYVMDSLGCEVSGQITIEQAGGLKINVLEQENPICHNGNDGSITVAIMGGKPPYTYLWNTGETTPSLFGLAEGVYTFQVTDANDCIAFKEIELEWPSPTLIDLGEDRTLCYDQVHYLDVSIDDPNATYLWTSTNGFNSTSPAISITDGGSYTATVTTGLGCSGSDTITIETASAEIDSQFLVSSQAFALEEVVLVNTSNPLGIAEDWIFPEEARVMEESKSLAVLRFDEPGIYEITLRNYKDECYEDFTKSIVVNQARQLPDVGDAIVPFIKEYKILPNPSSGMFTVMLSLQEVATVSLRLYGLTSNIAHDDLQLNGSANYEVPYSVDLPSGVYFLLLETAKESQIRKIVIL